MQNIRWSELFTREINLKFLLTNDKISCVKKFVLYCRMLKKKKKEKNITIPFTNFIFFDRTSANHQLPLHFIGFDVFKHKYSSSIIYRIVKPIQMKTISRNSMHCVIRAINFIKYPDSFFLFFFFIFSDNHRWKTRQCFRTKQNGITSSTGADAR